MIFSATKPPDFQTGSTQQPRGYSKLRERERLETDPKRLTVILAGNYLGEPKLEEKRENHQGDLV
jgi:hypothetical protein